MKSSKTPSHLMAYWGVRFMATLFGLIPLALIPLKSIPIRILIFRILGYRLSTIRKNIDFALSDDLSSKTRSQIQTAFEKQFSQILVENLISLGRRQAIPVDWFNIYNAELLDQVNNYNDRNKSILFYSHMGNWEWGTMSLPQLIQSQCFVVVKPLSNPYINKWLNQRRSANNMTVVQDAAGLRKFLSHDGPAVLIFLNDQYPADFTNVEKVRFFDKDISFNAGPATLAKRWDLNLYHLLVTDKVAGRYQLTINTLKAHSSAHDIIQEYAQQLQDSIVAQPHLWLWSHRRFKKHINY